MERFDFTYSPYEMLTPGQREILQSSVDIMFFDDEAVIIDANQPIAFLYVVIKGLVREVTPDNEIGGLYHSRDTFEPRALVEGQSPNRYIVQEQALVYTIPKATITELMDANPRFGAYFYASVAEKLSNLARSKGSHELESLFTAKVRDAYRHNATWLLGTDSILSAAQAMKKDKTRTILVEHQNKVGLFTASVFRDVVIAGASTDQPLHLWSAFELISVDIDDYVFNALLRMTQFKIQRVVVTENGKPIGALEQIDVLAYLSNHTHLVAQRLERAQNVDELVAIADQMTRSIHILRSNGVRAPQLAQLTQVLNTSLFEKAWRLLAPAELVAQSCLIVMGSEGRGEQILKTDQDNALIMRESADATIAKQVCDEFSHTLARLGYPPCKGHIMVNNQQWRQTIEEFKHTIFQWCTELSGESMMNLAIFVDAKAVAGDDTCLLELKNYLTRLLTDDAGMLGRFARAVDLFEMHSNGFFSTLLRREGAAQMDIKKIGIFPVVHGIRALSLEAQLSETNTFERINRLSALNVLDDSLSKDLIEALSYLMDLRLDAGLLNQTTCALEDNVNQIDTRMLTTLERDLLQIALQVVKRFKTMIRAHFHLGTF